eukprot:scaffold5851_cov51-Phaeocystis_antarctica.AAC.2
MHRALASGISYGLIDYACASSRPPHTPPLPHRYVGNYYYTLNNKLALKAAGGATGFPVTIGFMQLLIGSVCGPYPPLRRTTAPPACLPWSSRREEAAGNMHRAHHRHPPVPLFYAAGPPGGGLRGRRAPRLDLQHEPRRRLVRPDRQGVRARVRRGRRHHAVRQVDLAGQVALPHPRHRRRLPRLDQGAG